jgi:uncharacterized protein
MRELIEFIARSLVENPDEVRVSEIDRGNSTLLELRVGQGDIGKVIGREGRTARAIRTVLSAAASKSPRRYSLDIVD